MSIQEKDLSRRTFIALMGGSSLAALAGSSIALAGCSGANEQTEETTASTSSEDAAEQTGAESSEASNSTSSATAQTEPAETSAASNILVAYFSATGNTRRVAEIAADELDADVFEIIPAEPYSEADLGYNNDDSRVSHERAQGLTEVELAATAPEGGIAAYDTILLGYPIWWGGAAWPVGGFVSANDLAGKTVVPFCTSGSSGAGTSGEDLVGEPATRFSSSAAEDEVRSWAAGLFA